MNNNFLPRKISKLIAMKHKKFSEGEIFLKCRQEESFHYKLRILVVDSIV